MTNLADLLKVGGVGVKKDVTRAMQLYGRAAEGGSKYAARELKLLQRSMDSDRVKAVSLGVGVFAAGLLGPFSLGAAAAVAAVTPAVAAAAAAVSNMFPGETKPAAEGSSAVPRQRDTIGMHQEMSSMQHPRILFGRGAGDGMQPDLFNAHDKKKFLMSLWKGV